MFGGFFACIDIDGLSGHMFGYRKSFIFMIFKRLSQSHREQQDSYRSSSFLNNSIRIQNYWTLPNKTTVNFDQRHRYKQNHTQTGMSTHRQYLTRNRKQF